MVSSCEGDLPDHQAVLDESWTHLAVGRGAGLQQGRVCGQPADVTAFRLHCQRGLLQGRAVDTQLPAVDRPTGTGGTGPHSDGSGDQAAGSGHHCSCGDGWTSSAFEGHLLNQWKNFKRLGLCYLVSIPKFGEERGGWSDLPLQRLHLLRPADVLRERHKGKGRCQCQESHRAAPPHPRYLPSVCLALD